MMNDASRLTNTIITELYKNDNLFKLIKYDTPNALEQDALTMSEKKEITRGKHDIKNKRIHKINCNTEVMDDVRSEIRIYKTFTPVDVRAKVDFFIEVVVHADLWELDNGEERADRIVFELLNSLQDKHIKSIGFLRFNYPVKYTSFGKNYFGYLLCANTSIEW